MDIIDTLSTLTMTKEEIEFLASAQPDVKVRSTNKAKKDATQVQMMVESRANEDYTLYNRKAIINSLLNETDLSKAKAIEVAKKAEEVILKSNAKVVKTQFIREVVNQILFDMNIDQHLKYSSLSISLHDMETIFSVHNFENSNTDYTPESINLVTAGSILKQYALRKVFPHDIAEAHLKCDIHLHDLDFINRPYAFDGETSFVTLKNKKDGITSIVSMDSLFLTLETIGIKHIEPDGAITYKTDLFEILDKNNKWTDLISLTEIKETKDVYEIELESGEKLFVTEEHPCIVITDNKEVITRTDALKVGDTFYVKTVSCLSKIKSIKKVKTVDKVYDITTQSHTLLCNNIYVHNCSGNSIEYIKKNGLKLPNVSSSLPATHPQTLVNHLQCFASYLQGLFAGAIGFTAVNTFFSPLLVGLDYKSIKQVAQHLIFSFAQLAGNRGGQVVFSDFNMDLRTPSYLKTTPAVGAGGTYTGKTYKEYEEYSRLFLEAVIEVLAEGDADGANFAFPKILLHLTSQDLDDPLLLKVCELNSKRGSIYILYDRDTDTTVKVAQCCRLSITLSTEEVTQLTQHPEEMRFSAWQNVSINLPAIAYRCKTFEDAKLEIDRLVDIAMRAHIVKKDFLLNILNRGDKGCLAFLAKGMDGKPYLRIEDAKFLIGMIGLNEFVECMTGSKLSDFSNDYAALRFGLEVIAYLYKAVEKAAKEYNLNVILEETPAEGLSLRAAMSDLKRYPEAKKYVKGNQETGNVYYTNSVHLPYDADVDLATRIELQSKFAPLIKAGAIIHNWFGTFEPNPEILHQVYVNTHKYTSAVQTADSPDMTICKDCHKMYKGLHEKCPVCGSFNVYCETRITGYFSRVSGWTKSKLGELADRRRITTDINTEVVEAKEKILFFQKPNCEKCDFVKAQLKDLLKNADIEIVDTSDYKGLAKACFYNVNLLPAILKVNGLNVISKLEQKGSFLQWIKQNITLKQETSTKI